MNRLLYTYFFIVFLLVSCRSDEVTNLPMEEEKVIALLSDMHFAKSASIIFRNEERDSMRLVYENQALEINNISRKSFEDLMNVLESDLEKYHVIEKKVHAHLKKIQEKKAN